MEIQWKKEFLQKYKENVFLSEGIPSCRWTEHDNGKIVILDEVCLQINN
jgi:hypothetical protein